MPATAWQALSSTALRPSDIAALEATASTKADDMWVIISDLFLDRADVLANLGRVLGAFDGAEVPPTLFVFMGDFSSTPFGPASSGVEAMRGARAAHPRRG